MKFAIDKLDRSGRGLPCALRAAAGALLLTLAACGGGERVSSFAPQRLLVFGDEASVIAGGNLTDVDGNVIAAEPGAKYSVNARKLDATGAPLTTLDCNVLPIWVQPVANRFGFGFAECNPYVGTAPRGMIFAQVGARVANIATQVASALPTIGAFSNTDLVTVMVGQRDILEAYAQYPAQSAAAVVASVEAAGERLGNQINSIAQAGGRVLVATVPNQGGTPFAAAQNLISAERSALLQRMTERYNASLRATLINDGRLIGLVQADEQLQFGLSNPSAFGYVSVSVAACTTPTAINCVAPTVAVGAVPATPGTLVTGATAGNYLWADDRHFGVDAHARIGNLAVTRASRNPF